MQDAPAPPALATALFLHEQADEPTRQNSQLSLSLGESVEPGRLNASWNKMAAASPLLRSGFYRVPGGEFLVREAEPREVRWQTHDWSETEPAAIPALWTGLQAEELAQAFALENPPLMRGSTILLPGGHTHLLLTFPRFLLDEDALFSLLVEWLAVLEGHTLSEAAPTIQPVADSREWWSRYLQGAKEALALDIRPASGASGWQHHSVLLSREQSRALNEASSKLGISAQEFFFGAATLLLGRLAGTTEPLLLSNPPRSRNLLPSRIPLKGHMLAENWLKELSLVETTRAEHDASLPRALSWAQCEATAFPTAFVWSPALIGDRIHDAMPRWINLDAKLTQPAPAPLTVEVRAAARFSVEIHFDAARFPADQIVRLLDRYLRVLDSIAQNPSQMLRDISLLTGEEIEILAHKNNSPSSARAQKRIEERIVDTAHEHPDHLAVQGEGEIGLSFSELNSHAHSLASYLRQENLSDGWVIAVCLTPTPWLPVALLGIPLAGATCVPLDPNSSAAWLAEKTAACDAEVIVCDSETAALFKDTLRRLLIIDQQWETIAAIETPAEQIATAPKFAFLLTGTEQEAEPSLKTFSPELIAAACKESTARTRLKAGDHVALLATAGTGAFIETLLTSLVSGATLLLPPAKTDRVLASVGHASYLRLTAPQWRQIALDLSRGEAWPESIRAVCVETGSLSPFLLDAWKTAASGVSTHLFWSPAELSGFGLRCALRDEAGALPAGFPTSTITATLSDALGRELPPHYVGEAKVTLPGDSAVHWELPAWRDDNSSFYLAQDDQTEDLLRQLPGVADACMREIKIDDRSVRAAWIIPADPSSGSSPDWLRLLTESLPGAVRPDFLFPVETFPLTPGGHIDLAPLPKPPALTRAKAASPCVAATPAAPPSPAAEWEPLVLLSKESSAPTLFLVHDIEGDPGIYRPLAALLKDEWTLFATVARGLRQPAAAHQSVEAEAAALVEALCSFDPAGPYHLFGHGYGAILAYEMARQLRLAGRDVNYLALAGAEPPQMENGKAWLRSFTRIFTGATRSSLPLTPVAEGHQKALRDYRAQPLTGPGGVILGSDASRDAESAWLACMPEGYVERMSSISGQMLVEPGVKRLLVILSEWASGEDESEAPSDQD